MLSPCRSCFFIILPIIVIIHQHHFVCTLLCQHHSLLVYVYSSIFQHTINFIQIIYYQCNKRKGLYMKMPCRDCLLVLLFVYHMALKLAWENWSTKAATSAPLVICHGLFGSKQNWRSLARAFNTRLSRDIYAIVRYQFILAC